ncbi:MAG: LysR family transcriptional regulator [Deltaproteobacteria bacterium]|nr:LysR family transcriptional regulator [Deltaproteobacteria bacterium]
MELDHLAQFLHVVDSGSVSAAAKLAHLTQPAVSRNLKLLEDAVGAPLFERQGRGLVLTSAGRALVPKARAVLLDVAAATRTVRRAAERGYSDLRLGAVDSVASYLIPKLLAPVRIAFPDLHWKLRTARSAALLEQVDQGALDLAVVAASGPPKAERAFHLAPYTLCFYGRADRFAELAAVASDAELKQFPLVEIEALPGQPTMIDPEAPAYAIAHSLASVKAFVLAGFGIGAMLPFMLEPHERAQLVQANLPADPHCGLWAVCGPERSHGRARELEQLVIDELRQLAQPDSRVVAAD